MTRGHENGGAPLSQTVQIIAAVGKALRAQGAEEAVRLIPPPERFEEGLLPVRHALVAIVDGSRDPALAQDTRLDYDNAVELSLLLDALADD